MYRNTIYPETKASPALVLFGRPIRDAIPIPLGRYCPHNTWRETLTHREKALAHRHCREHEKWSEHTRPLPPLRVGDHVYLQNLTGNHPKKWERTGVVVEVRQFHQYVVRVDGSGRVTLRNRQHLRKYVPFRAADRVPPPLLSHPTPVPPARGTQDASDAPGPPAPPQEPTTEGNTPGPVVAAPEQDHADTVTQPTLSQPPTAAAPSSDTGKVPRALARLKPHNQPGTEELRPPRRSTPGRGNAGL